jgi:hypothetical protein
MTESIRIFVGSDIYNIKAETALKWSILKHTSSDIDFRIMSRFNNDETWKNWSNTGKWATCFSCFRWAIPAACNFQGRAIYLDSDMIATSDIKGLFDADCSKGIATTPKRESSVMVMDCEKFADMPEFQLDALKKNAAKTNEYYNLLKSKDMVSYIDQQWNCLDGDGYDINKTNIVHYTELPTQPWHPAPHRFTYKPHPNKEITALWLKYYEEAFEHPEVLQIGHVPMKN